jgi:hypothetical protein
MKLIVLVGTRHAFQYPGIKASNEFRLFLEELCDQHGVRAIGEELSEDALAEKQKTSSVCREIAVSRNIAHHYCDPSLEQRKVLGVLQENPIRIDGWLKGWPPEKIEQEIRASYSIREHYWRDQLEILDLWPALFVCGAEHVVHFRELVEKHGIEVIVATDDWEPQPD